MINRTDASYVVHMGSKGYRAESYFENIIQNTLTTETPIGFSEIWKRCRIGIGSKQTLSKYLKRLERTGLIIRDTRGYRISALSDYPRLIELRKSLRVPGKKSWQYSYFSQSRVRPQTVPKDQFLAMILQEFNLIFSIYRWMLTKVVQTENRFAAQELVGIFMRSQINPVLDELTKVIWLARKTVPLDALKNKKFVFTDG